MYEAKERAVVKNASAQIVGEGVKSSSQNLYGAKLLDHYFNARSEYMIAKDGAPIFQLSANCSVGYGFISGDEVDGIIGTESAWPTGGDFGEVIPNSEINYNYDATNKTIAVNINVLGSSLPDGVESAMVNGFAIKATAPTGEKWAILLLGQRINLTRSVTIKVTAVIATV